MPIIAITAFIYPISITTPIATVSVSITTRTNTISVTIIISAVAVFRPSYVIRPRPIPSSVLLSLPFPVSNSSKYKTYIKCVLFYCNYYYNITKLRKIIGKTTWLFIEDRCIQLYWALAAIMCNLLLLICVSWTITGQPRNNVFIRRV